MTFPSPTPSPTFWEWWLDLMANSGYSESRSFAAKAERFLTSSIPGDCISGRYDWTFRSESGKSGADYILGDRLDEFDVPIVELYVLERR